MSNGGSRPGIFFGWWMVAAASLIYLVSGGLFNTATIYIKALTTEFGWSRAEISGVFSLGFLVAGLSAPFWGRIADRRGPRAAFLPGAVLTALMCVLLSRISTLGLFSALYILFAFSASGISLIPVTVLISNWFVEKRGRAIGIAYIGEGIGVLLFVPLAGLLVANEGWRLAYVVSGVVVLALLIPVGLLVKNRPQDLGLRADGLDPATPGQGTSAAEGGEELDGFSMGEALRTPTFWLLSLTWLVAMMPMIAITLHQVPFMTDIGISTETASLVAGLGGGTSIIGRLTFGILSERYEIRPLNALCYVITGAGIAFLWTAPALGAVALGMYALLFGIGVGGAFALSGLLIGDLFGMRTLGEIYGLAGLFATVGGAVGGTGAGIIFDRAGSYDSAFVICIALAAAGAVLMLLVRRPQAPPRSAAAP